MTKKSVVKYAKRIKQTYFVRYVYFNLHEIIATKKQHIKVATYAPSQYIFDPITKGDLLKYLKNHYLFFHWSSINQY